MDEKPLPFRGGVGVGAAGVGLGETRPTPNPSHEGEGLRVALAAAAARFAFSPTPRLDAELLLAHSLGIERSALLLDLDRPTPAAFAALVDRRANHEPVAYITGTRGFWDIDLTVGPGVLVPRADSETLIEAAIDHFAGRTPARILDLGTGPGTLLLAALSRWPRAYGLGIDRSDVALGYARANAAALGFDACFRLGNWGEGLAERFDLVLVNPPYIEADEALPAEVRDYEPAGALFAGMDGLEDYRTFVPQLPALLSPGGAAVIEIGYRQAAAVTALLNAQGLTVALRQDLGGRDRCLVATP